MSRPAVDQFGKGVLAGCIAFLALINVLVIGVSLAQVPCDQHVALGIVGLAAAGGLLWGRAFARIPEPLRPAHPLPTTLRCLLALATGICLLAYFLLWYVSLTTLDASCDGNCYHLPTISIWMHEKGIHWICPASAAPIVRFVNGYAKGAETVGFVLATAFGPPWAGTFSLVFLLLGIWGIFDLARQLGACPWTAAFAASAYILVPANIWQSAASYVDSAFASCAIAFLAVFCRHLANGWSRAGPTSRLMNSITLGAAAGLMLGVKGNAVWMLAVAASVYFVVILARSYQARRRGHPKVSFRPGLVGVLRASATVVTVCLAVGGFWYMRNWAHTGNPLHPVGVTLLGCEVFPGFDLHREVLAPQVPQEFQGLSAPPRVALAWVQSGDFRTALAVDARLGGLGFFWIVGCLPSIGWVLVTTPRPVERNAPRRPPTALVLAGIVLLFFVLTPLNWWARFTIWIYGLGLPCFAVVLSQFLGSPFTSDGTATTESLPAKTNGNGEGDHRTQAARPRGHRGLRILCGAWLMASVGLLFLEGLYSLQRLAIVQRRHTRPAEAEGAEAYLFSFPQLQRSRLVSVLNEGDAISVGRLSAATPAGVSKFRLLGAISQPLGRRKIGVVGQGDPREVVRQLTVGGYRHLIWDDRVPLNEEIAAIAVLEETIPGILRLYRLKIDESRPSDPDAEHAPTK